MQWSVNGQVPWGDAGPLDQNAQPLVVIYRNLDGGYCYDALYSAELKQKLLKDALPTVKVDYDLFINFGKITGYNTRSVDGIQFNDGHRVVREERWFRWSNTASQVWSLSRLLVIRSTSLSFLSCLY